MARYSFFDLTEVLGGKTKVMIISGIVTGSFLLGGAFSTVARLGSKSDSSYALATNASEISPELLLKGTYYGHNGSVLILKDDGKADYYYMGLSDVQHNNTWSLQDDEITLELDWMFCTARGTIESGSDSFVLVGDTDLDDLLWDDERFDKINDAVDSMTQEECIAFISEHDESSSDDNAVTSTAEEYTSSYTVEDLDVTFVECYGNSLPVPNNLQSVYSDDMGMLFMDNNSGLAFACVPTDGLEIDHDELDGYGHDYLDGFTEAFGSGSINSQVDVLIGGHPAIEYSGVVLSQYNATYTIKTLIIDYSDEGCIFIVSAIYNSLNSSLLDYYHYAIDVLKTADGFVPGSTLSINDQTSSSGSSSVRETLDEYEEFMNEYIAFMQSYNNASPDQSLQMLDDYLELMTEYAEFVESIDNLDTSSMTVEDYAYYIEVTTRVSQNLLSIYS